jgi:hypothetical protein
MKKKTKRKTAKKSKPKIDVVIESLVNLEQKVKELIKEVNQLKNKNPYYDSPLAPMPTNPEPKYWPNTEPPFKYKDIQWGKLSDDIQ